MTPERWRVVRELFTAAAERDASSRASFLATACRDDSDLHAEVTSLLEASDGAGHFLESGVAERSAPVRIGPYHVVSEIGHGGMGTVYLAARDDEEYEKRVAIKLVRPGLYGDVVLHRFRSERQILARLEHPNIARLLEGGTTEDGLPYLVMEYVRAVISWKTATRGGSRSPRGSSSSGRFARRCSTRIGTWSYTGTSSRRICW
jgi:hypothetical protein